MAAHLDDPSWVVVDTRYNLADTSAGLAQYREGHIAGAVYASLSRDLASTPTGTNGRHPLPTVEAMAATFGRLGIGPGRQVVCYDADNMFAARLWWAFRAMGHSRSCFHTWLPCTKSVTGGSSMMPFCSPFSQ